jgi:hypothetical protein
MKPDLDDLAVTSFASAGTGVGVERGGPLRHQRSALLPFTKIWARTDGITDATGCESGGGAV